LPIEEGHLQGETGEDIDGRNLVLDIFDHGPANEHPVIGSKGIEYVFTLSLPGKTDWHTRWFWPRPQEGEFGPAPLDITADPFVVPPAYIEVDPGGTGTAWEDEDEGPIFWHTWPECKDVCGEEKELVENFARFNGIDSYIALEEQVPSFNNPFVVTCQFRYQGQPDWAPIWGRHQAGGFFGFDEHEVIFGNARRNTSWEPEVGVWYNYEYRFEQSGPLGHQQLIDDVIVMDAVFSRQFINANRLGVYRHQTTGTIWGHFDLKHLIYKKGTVGDFTTELHLPLQEDALDLSDNENHGTTFNMELPST